MSTTAVFKIIPTTQSYDWGKLGLTSKVAQFASQSQIPGFKIDERSPYAEVSSVSIIFFTAGWYPQQLWMGTHPTSPSLVLSSRKVLSEHLASHPELIGKSIVENFDAGNGSLPFLFKVLSIQKALSIQTHPNKQTAEILHAQHPDIYKGMYFHRYSLFHSDFHRNPDPNHKPEMALAITPFQALCGFRDRKSVV